MKKTAVCVCNYNKKEYVINCIDSALKNVYTEFDFYFIDNGSTDGSEAVVREKYGNRINYLINEKNTGSAGGFNTGIQMACDHNYDYVILLDHDVELDKNAIGNMILYAEKNEQVAVVGGKMLWYNDPTMIQIYGTGINKDTYSLRNSYKNLKDDETIPSEVECDFVPAGISLLKIEAVNKVGFPDEEFFTYWDDADYHIRFKKQGYQVMAISNAFVYHHFGTGENPTTFPTYMYWRNRLRFFAKHLEKSEMKGFCDEYLKNLFQALYACHYQQKENTIKSLMSAYHDGISSTFGIPKPSCIFPVDVIDDRATEILQNKKNVAIIFNGDYKTIKRVTDKILSINNETKIEIIYNQVEDLEKLKSQYMFPIFCEMPNKKYDAVLTICKHIFNTEALDTNVVYVDEYLNFNATERDRTYCKNFQLMYNFFYKTNYDLFFTKMIELSESRG